MAVRSEVLRSAAYKALSDTARRVLQVIEQKAGRGGSAISLDTFMSETELGRCSVRRGLRLAEELGFISVAVGPRHNHEFRLVDDWRDVDADGAAQRVKQARLPTPPRPRSVPPKVKPVKVEVVEPVEQTPPRAAPSLPRLAWLGDVRGI
jgi:hypothetical protein